MRWRGEGIERVFTVVADQGKQRWALGETADGKENADETNPVQATEAERQGWMKKTSTVLLFVRKDFIFDIHAPLMIG